MLYNDRAVLENHHISAAFRLMKEDEFNVLSNLKREEYRSVFVSHITHTHTHTHTHTDFQ